MSYVYQYDIYHPNKNESGNAISNEMDCLCDFDQCNDENSILNAEYAGGAYQVWIIKSLDIYLLILKTPSGIRLYPLCSSDWDFGG